MAMYGAVGQESHTVYVQKGPSPPAATPDHVVWFCLRSMPPALAAELLPSCTRKVGRGFPAEGKSTLAGGVDSRRQRNRIAAVLFAMATVAAVAVLATQVRDRATRDVLLPRTLALEGVKVGCGSWRAGGRVGDTGHVRIVKPTVLTDYGRS